MVFGKWVCVGLLVMLVACESTDEHLRRQGTDSGMYDAGLEASAEALYFELVRLHSMGLVGPERMEALQDNLDWVEAHSEAGEREEQERQLLASMLRRTLSELRREQDPVVMGSEGRAYARKLHSAGVREARRYAKGTLFIAGMLGVPTSEEDLVLMVAIPVGGYVVVKVGGMAFKRAAFLLRRARTVDDVVDRAKAWGFRPRYAASETELREVAGDAAAETLLRTESHVGARRGVREGKENPWNPSERDDNCTACVATVIRNSLEGYFVHSADDMERLFGYTGRERAFSPEDSLRYIERATGLKASRRGVAILEPRAPVGHYAIFTRWSAGDYNHVVYGRVTPAGRVVVFDPQTMEHMSYQELLKRHGKARPHLLEAP
ncbi:hypothetical protein [Archangium sp.]|uniref:hypothetical protein n=1 Tax=Archangium sp. TaxID=1872627 RepID=UPI002D6C9020|nr:hypothetical protein [Archangium sp.]HYO57659.1 hypothetical protein [Archangium sp.]